MTQKDLFDCSSGFDRGMEGARRALDRAERVVPEWSELAFAALSRVYSRSSDPMTIEQARLLAGLESPADKRAWGGVVQRMSRRGLIRRVGYAPAESSNGSPKPLWVGSTDQ